RPRPCPRLEAVAKHHDPAARRVDAFDQSLSCATEWKSPGPHFSLRRSRGYALHARVFSREISVADRVFESASKRSRIGNGLGVGCRELRASPWRIGWPGAA